MHFPTARTAHTTAFEGPVVDHWMEWKIAQTANASTMQDRSTTQEDLYHTGGQLSAQPPELRSASVHCTQMNIGHCIC